MVVLVLPLYWDEDSCIEPSPKAALLLKANEKGIPEQPILAFSFTVSVRSMNENGKCANLVTVNAGAKAHLFFSKCMCNTGCTEFMH